MHYRNLALMAALSFAAMYLTGFLLGTARINAPHVAPILPEHVGEFKPEPRRSGWEVSTWSDTSWTAPCPAVRKVAWDEEAEQVGTVPEQTSRLTHKQRHRKASEHVGE